MFLFFLFNLIHFKKYPLKMNKGKKAYNKKIYYIYILQEKKPTFYK